MADPAYRTISEVAALVGVPHHVLRFWETKFPAIAPLKRGGNRRYYRPDDVALITTIARLLHSEGYTIKGAQKLLAAGGDAAGPARPSAVVAVAGEAAPDRVAPVPRAALAAIRADLATALAAARAM